MLRIKQLIFLLTIISCKPFFSQSTNIAQNLDSIPKEEHIKDTVIEKAYRRLRIASNYSNSNSFLGKLDSVSVPIITNSLKYTTSKNIFYQLNFIHGTKGVLIDEVDARIGYTKYMFDNIIVSASYTHFFYNSNVDRFNAIVNNDINCYFAYDWNYLFSAISIDYTTGHKNFIDSTINLNPSNKLFRSILTKKDIVAKANDFNLTFMNSKQFYFYEVFSLHDRFILSPEIDIIVGKPHDTYDQSLTYFYYMKNINILKPKIQKDPIPKNVLYNKLFCSTIINIDLRYVYKNLTFNISPYYYIPYNIGVGIKERNSPYLVWYSSIFYNFKWERLKHRK